LKVLALEKFRRPAHPRKRRAQWRLNPRPCAEPPLRPQVFDLEKLEEKMEALANVLEMPKPKPEPKQRAKRGEGAVYHPKFKDKKTGELRESPHCWIRYTVRGKQVKESSGSEKLAVAERLLRRRLGERDAGILQPTQVRAERITYEAMRDYLYADYEIRKYKSLLTRRADGSRYIGPVPTLDDFFKQYRASNITAEAMKEFIRKRQEQGIGNAGINGSLRMLRKMFSLQVKERKFPRNLVPSFPMLPNPKPRRDFLTLEQHATLVKHLPEELRPLQIVSYDTGARRSELLKLTWDRVDLERGSLTFLDTKNGEDRVVPLGQQALKTFQEMNRTPGGLVFVRANGEPIKDFRRAWLNALRAAGLGKHLFHGNRRSQAVNLMTAGVDEQTAMELTGHKDSETFRGYRVLVEEAKRAAIAKRDSVLL
jgi:integrase